jgi:hypothetical protein
MASGISRTEAQVIRSKLRLRFNTLYNCYEVFTTVHGSGTFQWMMITDDVAAWYKEHFKLTVESYLQPSLRTGGLIEMRHSSPPPVVA